MTQSDLALSLVRRCFGVVALVALTPAAASAGGPQPTTLAPDQLPSVTIRLGDGARQSWTFVPPVKAVSPLAVRRGWRVTGAALPAGVVLFERDRQRPATSGWKVHSSALTGNFGRHDEVLDATLETPEYSVRLTGTNASQDDYEDGDGNKPAPVELKAREDKPEEKPVSDSEKTRSARLEPSTCGAVQRATVSASTIFVSPSRPPDSIMCANRARSGCSCAPTPARRRWMHSPRRCATPTRARA